MKDFWKNKKVLVTGHTGFVGTWLILTLQYLGADVFGISLKEDENSLYARVKDKLKIKNMYVDLRDKASVNGCVEAVRPDIVFHLAAFGFIQECFQDPERAYSTNVIGTMNLLEVLKDIAGIKTIIVASSDKVYKNTDENVQCFTEKDSLGGIDPYSCSKTGEDLLTQSYYHTYFKQNDIGMAILRPSNILGGGDHNHNRLIPHILDCIKNKVPLDIRNPQSVRPWQHILDMIDAYLFVAEYSWDKGGLDIFNIGPKSEQIITVGEIADILLEISGQEKQIKFGTINKKNTNIEHSFLGLSIDKIFEELKWEPQKTIYDTLYDVWRFKQDELLSDSYEACINQIQQYYE